MSLVGMVQDMIGLSKQPARTFGSNFVLPVVKGDPSATLLWLMAAGRFLVILSLSLWGSE